jgi:hypothetical protein
MPKKPTKLQKPFWEMTTAELAEATKEFAKEFVINNFRPLTAAERKQWERLNQRRGRPKVGKEGEGHFRKNRRITAQTER